MKFRTKHAEIEAVQVRDVLTRTTILLPTWVRNALDSGKVQPVGGHIVLHGRSIRPSGWLIYRDRHLSAVTAEEFDARYEPIPEAVGFES